MVAGDAVVHLGGVRGDGVGQVGDGRQVGVVDLQQFGGVAGLLLRVRDHHGDRIADVAHLADRDHRMRRFGHGRAVLAVDLPAAGQPADALGRHVGADEHFYHAGCCRCRRDVDAVDLRMRAVGAFDDGVELAGTVDVVGVVAFAAEEADVLFAANGCADAFEAHGRYPLFRCPVREPRLFGGFGVHQWMSGGDGLDDVMVTGCSGTGCLPGLRGSLFRSGRPGATAPCRRRS